MPFQLGDIKISGTIDEISFYNSVFGWLVRRKGGPSRKQFKTSPTFERSRENSTEFTACSKVAALIRRIVLQHTGVKDKSLYHRLMSTMRLLADWDMYSPRGAREPLKGMLNPGSHIHLKNFHLSGTLSLYEILQSNGLLSNPGKSPQAQQIKPNNILAKTKTRRKRKTVFFIYRKHQSKTSVHVASVSKNTAFG